MYTNIEKYTLYLSLSQIMKTTAVEQQHNVFDGWTVAIYIIKTYMSYMYITDNR